MPQDRVATNGFIVVPVPNQATVGRGARVRRIHSKAVLSFVRVPATKVSHSSPAGIHFGERADGLRNCPVCRAPVIQIQKAFVA